MFLRLHVHPGAGRTSVVGRHGDALKVRVSSPPQGGRANQACISLLATTLGIKEDQVELVGGVSSRMKRARITGADPADIRHLLDEAVALAAAPGTAKGGRGIR